MSKSINETAINETAMRHERIEINPDIMDGKPVIRGTRVPVELVLRKLGDGMSPEAILVDHPRGRLTTSGSHRLLPPIISPTKTSSATECALARR